jgi:hypothetical protein
MKGGPIESRFKEGSRVRVETFNWPPVETFS